MPRSFKCPSCSAPLEYEGTPAQKCSFCTSTVIVDSEVKSHFDERPEFGFGSLLDQAQKLKRVKWLVQSGNKIQAIKEYREVFGGGLKEAKDAVDNIEAGKPIVFSTYQSGHPAEINLPFSKVDSATVERAAKTIGISFFTVAGVILAIGIGMAVIILIGLQYEPTATTIPTGDAANTTNSIGPKATPTPTPEWATEVAKFGGKGIGPGQFKDNRSITVDAEGNIYSGDYTESGKIQVLDQQGNFKRQIEIDPDRALKDIVIDRAGNLFILLGAEVHRFEAATGKSLGKITATWPNDLAVGLDGLIYGVTSDGDIFAMTPDGKETKRFKKVVEQANLKRYMLEGLTLDGQGNMYVIERMGCYVLKFDREGKFQNRFGGCTVPGEPQTKGMFMTSPREIVVDNKGRILASDVGTIYVFNPDGGYIDQFKSSQSFGMFITDKNELWVAARPHVLKYQLP